MAFPILEGRRCLALGSPGKFRDQLNHLVTHGSKRATAGLLAEYEREGEPLEHPGEIQHLVDNAGKSLCTLRVTRVEVVPFLEVTFDFAQAEGEGFTSIEHWRTEHLAYWESVGEVVGPETRVVMMWFELV